MPADCRYAARAVRALADKTSCVTNEEMAAFLEDRLPAAAVHSLRRHLNRCMVCAELLEAVASSCFTTSSTASAAPTPTSPGPAGESASTPAGAGLGTSQLLSLQLRPPASYTPPLSFDNFRLRLLLGQGAMGQVWLADDLILDRPVAIKFIAQREPDEAARQRFLIEARAVARLLHPNVVAIHTVGEIEGHQYLVSELVRGRSLDKLDKPLPWEDVHRIGLDLARGLAAAHRRGVVHRDLKPANAIMSNEGVVKLLDFGLAKLRERRESEVLEVADSAATASGQPHPQPEMQDELTASAASHPSLPALTERGSMVGTPLYMAPEVWLGRPANAASDVYSLGVLLYELCAGAVPHASSTLDGLRQNVLHSSPMPLTARVPNVDRAIAETIMRCMQLDPGTRFPSGEELLQALSLIRPRATGTIPQGNPYRGLSTFQAEHRALFFGREADINTAVERLRSEPLLVLAGDSGVGKSSLCYAGILPRVAEETLGDGRQFSVTSMLPGKEPVRALALALAPYLDCSGRDALSFLQSSPAEVPRRLQARLGERGGLLLFVDQMEELLTQSEPAVATRAAGLLTQLADRWPGIRVLSAVRGDFLTRVAALPGLSGVLVAHLQLVFPMAAEALRIVVAEPARRKGFTFSPPELVDEIIQSLHGDGGLPLLQFALAQLWELRDDERRTISERALQQIGGVTGALTRHADQVLAALLPAQQAAARRLVCKLVTAEDTRARRRESELSTGDPAEAPALAALLRGRLIFARGGGDDSEYELAHEALIRCWPQLRDWLTAEGERRLVRQRLEQAAREWARLGYTDDSLWNNAQLRELHSVGVDRALLGERERRFLDAAATAQVRRRRLRLIGISLLPVIAVSLLFLGLLWRRSQLEAARAREFAWHKQESAQRESGLRAYSLALQVGREREALLGAVQAVDLSLGDGSGLLQPAALTGLRAAVQVGRQSMPLSGHHTAARWAAFSADGAKVVTVDESESARLWETATGRLIAVLPRRGGFSYRVFFSPDGKYIIVPLLSGITQLWDAGQGTLIAELDGGTGPVSHAAVSPQSRWLATVSGMSVSAKPFLHIWDLRTRQLVRSIHAHTERIQWVEYSPDGRLLLTASWDHTARLFDSTTGRLTAILRGHTDQLELATFSPDGALALTGSADGTARLWRVANGEVQFVLAGHTNSVRWAAFSPDGKHVLTASLDGTARVWDPATGKLRHTLALHNAPVHTAVATADSRRIVTSGDDQTIRIWSMQTGQELSVLRGHGQQVLFAFLSAHDEHIISGDMSGSVRLWSGASGKYLNTLRGSIEFSDVMFSANGRFLATNGEETIAQQLWDGRTGFPIARLVGHMTTSSIVALSPDGSRVVTVGKSPDNTLRLWHTENIELGATAGEGPATRYAVDGAADGRWFVVADAHQRARILDWETGKELYSHPLRFSRPRSAFLSPDSKYLAVSYRDGSLQVLDPVTGREYLGGSQLSGPETNVAFSPDSAWLVAAGRDGILHRWRVADFGATAPTHLSAWVRFLHFSPDSRWLAALLVSSVAILEVDTGRVHRQLEHRPDHLQDNDLLTEARFASDSRRLVTASYDRTARIWDAQTGQTLTLLRGHSAFVNGATFSPDGQRVATASGDGTVRIWDAQTGELVRPKDPGTLLVAVEPLAEADSSEVAKPVPLQTVTPLLRLACRLLHFQPEYSKVEATCRDYQP